MPKEESFPLLDFIKAVSFTLNQFRLYSGNHPIVKESLERLSAELERNMATREKIVIGHMRDTLVIEGQLVTKKDPAFQDFAKTLQRLGIEAMNIEKGVTLSELTSFLKLLGMRPKDLEAKGGFKKAFEDESFKAIKLASGKFQLIEEGQAVFDETVAEAASAGASSKAPAGQEEKTEEGYVRVPSSIFEVIQRIRSTAPENPGHPLPVLEFDYEKVVFQLEKQPQEAAEAAVQQIQDPEQMEQVVRNIAQNLTEGLISFLVENAKDITKALEKFSKEIEKAIHKSLGESGSQTVREKVGRVFQEAIDHHRIQMAVHTFERHRDDPKPVQKMIQKLFQKEEVRERLFPALRDRMVGAGFNQEVLDGIFEGMEERTAKKKSTIAIDAAELAELKRKAKLFDKGEGGGEVQKEIRRLKAEKKKVVDEKERVDAVIRHLAEGLVVVDQTGKVVMMNPAAENLLGVKQSEKLGQKVADGLKPEHLVAMTEGHLRDNQAEVAKDVALQSLSEETRKVLQASTAVIENEDGHTVGMVAVLSDVTKQKEVEKMKSQFVANVSHELRTPLVAIQKSLSVILGKEVGEISPEQEKFLSMAHRNIERLSRLINDLLDVAKLESGKMTLQARKVPLGSLMQMVLGTMETWFKDKHITVETHFSHPEIEIEADPDRLTQVITNLMGNAVKYTPDGGTITLEVKDPAEPSRIAEKECVEISVRDTGIGIAPEDQKKIFDKFVQVSLAQPAGVSSTGLGLTIVKEIIELHSGGIFIESEVGKGSRFYFQLPKHFKLREEIRSTS